MYKGGGTRPIPSKSTRKQNRKRTEMVTGVTPRFPKQRNEEYI